MLMTLFRAADSFRVEEASGNSIMRSHANCSKFPRLLEDGNGWQFQALNVEECRRLFVYRPFYLSVVVVSTV